MLSAAKRSARASLGLAVSFAVVAVFVRTIADLPWSFRLTYGVLIAGSLGLLALLIVDGFAHLVLEAAGEDAYRAAYRGLVDYFEGQPPAAILAGGLLAGSEELLFRGVVLVGLLQLPTVPSALAVIVSGIVFGVAHYVPGTVGREFVVWAAWQGVLLGALYVLTGSLIVPVLAHALHDIVGFTLFAWQREHGLLVRGGDQYGTPDEPGR